MALIKVDEHGGIIEANRDAGFATPARTGPFYIDTDGRGFTGNLYDPVDPASWTHLSYDPVADLVILTTGRIGFEGEITFTYDADGNVISVNKDTRHVLYHADTLDPGLAFKTDGLTAFCYPFESAAWGFYTDPNTQRSYETWQVYVRSEPRGSRSAEASQAIVESSGTTRKEIGVGVQNYGSQSILDSNIPPAQTLALTSLNPAAERIVSPTFGLSTMRGDFVLPLATIGAITLDDVGIFLADGILWMATRSPAYEYRGTSPSLETYAFQLSPVGVDRFMTMEFSNLAGGAVYVGIYRYNRALQRAEIEQYDRVPTSFNYEVFKHTGWATYDMKRQLIVMLEPDGADWKFVRYTFEDLCHPIMPTRVYRPSPLEPVHAGRTTIFEFSTRSEIMPTREPLVSVSYGGTISAGQFTQRPDRAATDTTGNGRIDVGFASAASGATCVITCAASSWSTAISSTVVGKGPLGGAYSGARYGVVFMSILNSSATFNVSGFISAGASAGIVTGATVILAGTPVSSTDAVGAGSPRQLVYPTSALPSPLTYELNPQQWTNMAAEALVRPLYAATRTLTKTQNVQFAGDVTDLEVKEIWMGGGGIGGRAAMTFTFFSQLYNYYRNVPDVRNDGFIQWKPRDLNNHVYNVLLTSLTVGGSEAIQLDTLARAAAGFITESVTLTMRIVSQAS